MTMRLSPQPLATEHLCDRGVRSRFQLIAWLMSWADPDPDDPAVILIMGGDFQNPVSDLHLCLALQMWPRYWFESQRDRLRAAKQLAAAAVQFGIVSEGPFLVTKGSHEPPLSRLTSESV